MFRILAILALACSFAGAAERIAVVKPKSAGATGARFLVEVNADGSYVLTVKAGSVTLESLPLVVIGTPVVPTPTPTPTPDNALAKAIVAEISKLPASDARHAAAMKLSATYQMLAGQLRDGKIHSANAVAAADLICPIALVADGKAWTGVFAVVNAAVGKARSDADCGAVFDAAATAVMSTVPASGDVEAAATRYGFDWNAFLAFLMQLMQILLPLIIS